ncbi:L,D-transpeptidase [uncultured Winogradskyella sp.]|uniref:L,D-transpeptidase n=1 Tax=uncultured Winogradskyella sp. TaxID=395353 RepID=UPI00260FC831|nr:L,D-transpeptidase [uncultured Winogradskyella sp.]
MKKLVMFLVISITIILLFALKPYSSKDEVLNLSLNLANTEIFSKSISAKKVVVQKEVLIENYFNYLDSIVKKFQPLTTYNLNEHLLVRANPWIIDTLQNTDYYRMMAKDSFVYNQKKMIALPMGNTIVIPDSMKAKKILNSFENTTIDINIPEFKLRIYEDSVQLFEFPIRVGRDEKKYLEMSGRIQDLKTKTGKGFIINHVRNPRYVNPVNNHQYFVTKRDDGKVTKLPQIPFIETEINGLRYGQLIHPTTNPRTLGKAYSNGCIGVKEADAWVIYFYAPINTKINIRYDLSVVNEMGDIITLKDIY